MKNILAAVISAMIFTGMTVQMRADEPTQYKWKASGVLVSPIADPDHQIISVKDPSVVRYKGQWHIYATTADKKGTWSMVHLKFKDWSEAAKAKPYYLDSNPGLKGYHCAPQVFYFTPQKKWYLIFQSGQPQYSTVADIDKPENLTPPKDFFKGVPGSVVDKAWLDFWVICDKRNAYLFFTGDNGRVYRSQTTIKNFPEGMSQPVQILREKNPYDLYEGGATYHLKGQDKYLMMIEALGPGGQRFYKSFIAASLDGDWKPQADSWENPLAGMKNVSFGKGVKPWTTDISHGEIIRQGYDESMTIDPKHLQLLFQGRDPGSDKLPYSQLPYRLGLLEAEKRQR
jgi:hypothetical protein